MTDGLIDEVWDLGYATVRNVLSDAELSAMQHETCALIEAWIRGDVDEPAYWAWQPDGQPRPILYRIHELEKRSAAVRRLLADGSLRYLAETLVGWDCRPTACALTIKMPGYGLVVPWHRDPIDVAPRTVFNFSVYLDHSDESNGCLRVVPRSHVPPRNALGTEDGPPHSVPVPAEPGDVIVHDVAVLHGSPACRGNARRRAVVVEFQPASI